MARGVFFSFHYENDVWRAGIVRSSNVVDGTAAAGFLDASIWEEAKKKGDAELKRLIKAGLENTTVTVVLIGAATASRSWVDYEIQQSIERGNGLFGIYVDRSRIRSSRPRYAGTFRSAFKMLRRLSIPGIATSSVRGSKPRPRGPANRILTPQRLSATGRLLGDGSILP